MRIVGGSFRGKKLALPSDKRIRPTSDRTREALFNILGHDPHFHRPEGALPLGARVLDVFAGTGALGFEALSRGASHLTFLDNHPDSLALLRQNSQAFGVMRKLDILNRDGTHPGQTAAPFDLVLMDPPYNLGLATLCLTALRDGSWLTETAIIVIELAAKEAFDCPEGFEEIKERKYGAAKLVFLKRA